MNTETFGKTTIIKIKTTTMARPKKTGLDYFSMDVDIFQDLKVRKLLKRKGGARAFGVFMSIICLIYKEGYYLDYDEDTIFVVADDMSEDEEYVRDVVKYCIEVGLFCKSMFEDHQILTSHGIQERYASAQMLSKRKYTIDSKFDLLTTDEASETIPENSVNVENIPETAVEASLPTTEEISINTGNSADNQEKEEKSESFFGIIPENFGIIPEDSGNVPESSVLKKNKEKKNKINSSTTSSSSARESESGLENSDEQEEGLDAEITQLLQDAEWAKNVGEMFGIPIANVVEYLEKFKTSCKCRGMTQHLNEEDTKRHFVDWLRKWIAEEHNRSKQTEYARNAQTTNDKRRAVPVPTEARPEDYAQDF